LRYRFTSRWQRVVGASLFGGFFFLETGAYFDKNGTQPGEIAFTSALLAVIVWGGVRAARAATLLANDDKITVRGLFRTRSWSWDEIDGFVVETRLVGRYINYRRRMLGMRGHDGTVRWFRELICRPARGARRSRVDDAAATLNRYVSSRPPSGVENQ
jgi:Bacterial PH domain